MAMRVSDLLRGGLLLAAAAAVVIFERRRRARAYVEPAWVHQRRNLAVAGLAAVTVQLLEAPVVVPLARTVGRRQWGLTSAIGGPGWLRTLIALVLLDYTLYLWHRLVHHVPWLWRFHLVHHVDLDLDASTGLRFHAGELAASIPWRAAQVVLIGVTPTVLTTWQSLTIASVLFHHSNSALSEAAERRLSWIVTTPRMHALHHSVDQTERDSNYSSGLAVWDWLHGSARRDRAAADVRIGVAGYLEPRQVTLSEILSLPFDRHLMAGENAPPRRPA